MYKFGRNKESMTIVMVGTFLFALELGFYQPSIGQYLFGGVLVFYGWVLGKLFH